jgi:hypothetical protein
MAMVLRLLMMAAGAGLVGSAFYLGWRHDMTAALILPPSKDQTVWIVPGVFAVLSLGCVAALAALRIPSGAASAARQTARDRALERTWRSGAIAPPAADESRVPTEPQAPPRRPGDEGASVADPIPAPPRLSRRFPATGTLQKIPRAASGLEGLGAPRAGGCAGVTAAPEAPGSEAAADATPPPVTVAAPAAPACETGPAAGSPISAAETVGLIEEHLRAGRLAEAGALIDSLRRSLEPTDETVEDRAILCVLAAEHAQALGRPAEARWMLRLALQRLAGIRSLDGPWARRAREQLRLADE